jgi:alpha-tubulin suppressor-like RCC1 family protein
MLLDSQGDIYSFGCSLNGRLGLGQIDNNVPVPTKLTIPEKICQISCAGEYSIGLSFKGQIYSW